MKKLLFTIHFIIVYSAILPAQSLPLLKISDDNHYLVSEDNKSFFWLGGTAWELLHRLNREETELYLTDRANKGFTVIQTVVLAELDGLNTPNAYGHKPLIDNNPAKINEDYFTHVDYVIQKAEELGLYIGLLPTWGDKFNKKWGVGPEIFTPENAEVFGELLAKRYHNQSNIIWLLGGDRAPEKDVHYNIINAMAKGIRKIDHQHMMSYHPVGAQLASTFFNTDWLDFDMYQSGHSRKAKEYQYVLESRKVSPTRPVINGEARYENIPDRFWEETAHGWLDDADVRVSAYWSMLAGAAGYTYGCNDIWQMYDIDKEPTLRARTEWSQAIHLPGSGQMKFMKELFEAFPWQKMVYTPSLVLNNNPEDSTFMTAAIGKEKDFLMVYTPVGHAIQPDLSKLDTENVIALWFNPRSGKSKNIGEYKTSDTPEFVPWSYGWGSDFVLVVMDANAPYKLP